MPRALKKIRREIIGLWSEGHPVRFSSPDVARQNQLFTLRQIFEKSWEYAKDVFTCFVDPRESIRPGSSWKTLGSVAGVQCWRPPSHWVPAQKFMSVSRELNHDLSPWDKDVCCRHSSSTVYMNWMDSHSRDDKGVTVGSCMINHLLLADDLLLLASRAGFKPIWPISSNRAPRYAN